MIESKEQVFNGFRDKARAFLASPSLLTGIDFDDATVTLKRYVMSELHDQELASTLGGFQKLIRQMDVARLTALVTEIENKLND